MSSFLGGGVGGSGQPGFVPPAATAQLGQNLGIAETAMSNRYNQLGSPAGATPRLQDLGQAFSYTGGIPQQFNAVLGQLQNSAVGNAPLGKNTSPASKIGSAGNIARLF